MVGYISPLTAVSESSRTGNVREGEVRISATRRQRKERNAGDGRGEITGAGGNGSGKSNNYGSDTHQTPVSLPLLQTNFHLWHQKLQIFQQLLQTSHFALIAFLCRCRRTGIERVCERDCLLRLLPFTPWETFKPRDPTLTNEIAQT